ncbi:scavenger receptor class B member 1-like [Diorhabda carinulata]|uniref:scavenger receptor class B member 1-like n=1 Tax=Diorhabda carinulata TaxID=1163345 RepID=UPI0025A12B46|nr:scavenger receptor class B member 1-like [Diorhabda carinulata]
MMYPNDETLRVDSENGLFGGKHSYLERNCNQIFMRGPALTKEILEKVQEEIVPKKTYIFGHEYNTKRILFISGLAVLFLISLTGAVLTWFTNAFDDLVLSQVVLKNNSKAFDMWKKPPVRLRYNVYLFNYTNVDDYRDGIVEKLHLEEIGPYVYEEVLERINISFPTEDTISYREYRTLSFKPNLSKGNQDDQVIVPNVPVLAGSAFTKSQNYFNRLAFSGILSGMDEEAFSKISAGSFIMGYEDRFYSLAKNFLPFDTPEELGIMVKKLGQSPYSITINSGKNDMNKFAQIEKFDGKKQLDYFSGDCNSIQSTDGALNPPKRVRAKQPLYYMFPEGCRRMPLVFNKETTIRNGTIPVYQYTYPEDIYDSADEKPENRCYCSDQCPLKGVFNITGCSFGCPTFISHPHFHRADPRLVKHFTGLHPERTTYKSYFNYHPTIGFLISARNLIQLNVQVQKAGAVSQVDMFDDGMILPFAWLEGVLDEKTLPQELIDTINLATFIAPTVNLILKYGCLLTAIITFIFLILVNRKEKRTLSQNLIRTHQGYSISS